MYKRQVTAIIGLGRAASRVPLVEARLLTGLAIAILGMVLMGFTTSFYGELYVWFDILLGAGVSLMAVRAQQSIEAIADAPY